MAHSWHPGIHAYLITKHIWLTRHPEVHGLLNTQAYMAQFGTQVYIAHSIPRHTWLTRHPGVHGLLDTQVYMAHLGTQTHVAHSTPRCSCLTLAPTGTLAHFSTQADLVSVSSSWGVSDLESIAYQQTAH